MVWTGAMVVSLMALVPNAASAADSGAPRDLPVYIVLNMAKDAGSGTSLTIPDYRAILEEVKMVLATTHPPSISIGVSFVYSVMERSPENLERCVRALLEAAEDTMVPILITLDGQNWWERRPELWNWWDPDRPGYDPANVENVEWTSWSSQDAVKIGWRNWGTQIRVAPAQNIASPKVIEATHAPMRRVIPIVASWYTGLPEDKKRLCIGVKLGWEAGIGYNAYHYPGGNTFLERWPADASHDPRTGLDLQKGLSGGVAQIGYAAAKTAGLKNSGALTRHDVGEAVQRYLAGLAKLAHDAGMPSHLVVVHQGGTYAPYHEHLPYEAAFNPWSTPGWSFYFVGPAEAGPLEEAMRSANRTRWAAAEWLWPGSTAQEWQDHLERTLRFLDCRYVCIYNWDQGGVSATPEAVEGIRRTLQSWARQHEQPSAQSLKQASPSRHIR